MNNITRQPERRKNKRISSKRPLQYQHANRVYHTLTKDISIGGVKMLSSHFLPIACRMLFGLSLKEDQEPIQTMGEVAWTEKLPHSEQYNTGVAFKELNTQTMAALNSFLSQEKPKKPSLHI